MRNLLSAAITAVVFASTLSAASTQAYDGYDRSVLIINDTSVTIENVYAGNADSSYYRNVDLLGNEVLYPGESIWVDPEDYSGYCRYYFKAVFSDGDVVQSRNTVNACESDASWRLYE